MQPDLLQQLRDIHLPPDPVWWPPAPGWWLLALLALVACFYLVRHIQQAVTRRRPIREARKLYDRLHLEYLQGLIDAPAYLHRSNELLKRLLIFGLHKKQAGKANDERWLALLDEVTRSRNFSSGPGLQLGNQRFQRLPEADPETLHPILERLFRKARP